MAYSSLRGLPPYRVFYNHALLSNRSNKACGAVPNVRAHRLLAPLRWDNTRGASSCDAYLSSPSSHNGEHEPRVFLHHNVHENRHVKNVSSHVGHDCDRKQSSNLPHLHYHYQHHDHILHASVDHYVIFCAF